MKGNVFASLFGSLSLVIALSACGVDDAVGAPGLDERAPLASEGAPELDLETRQADTPAGTIVAERSSAATYVGAAGDEVHIAVTLDEGTDAGFPQRALVYLCDGVNADYITGDVGTDATTLEGAAWDVELSVGEDVITGTATRHGEEPQAFTASEASGNAGVYAADFSHEGFDYRPVWIVNSDESQRGGACWRCCSGESCHICCPTTADTAGPTVDWSELQYWWVKWRE